MGDKAYNEERAFADQPPISIAAFLLSAESRSSTLLGLIHMNLSDLPQ
jgi:hypothetical protein